MRRVLLAVLSLMALIVAFLIFAPREPVGGDFAFDASVMADDADAYLARVEARFDDITPGVEKRVIWADPEARTRTPISIVYIHGFSATSEEIRPVPDRVAEALGANLHYTRLTGHGRGGPAMGEATVADWRRDLREAMAVGRLIGERVVVIGTSTGATLITLDLADMEVRDGIVGVAMIAPNFRIASPAARVLTLPLVRHWGPPLFGPERSFKPANEAHARYTTTRYPTVATIPLGALVAASNRQPFGAFRVPALFYFSDDDQVIDQSRTREIAEAWGGPMTLKAVTVGEGDDPFSHVVTGDMLSPGQTDAAVETLIAWIEGLD
ncbi:MAG: alpha/beta fold hydrolase [Pseudomonadota bacterium]